MNYEGGNALHSRIDSLQFTDQPKSSSVMWRFSRSSSDLKRAHPDTPVPYQCQRAVEDIRIQLRFCHRFDSRTEQAIRLELRTPFHCMAKC